MTNSEKKRYLNQYRVIDANIQRKLAECERWRAMAEKITPSFSDMPKSGGANRIEQAVEQIDKLEREINAEVDQLVNLRREIRQAIAYIPDETLRTLTEYRYIDQKTFEEIAVAMRYSWRHTHRMHAKALDVIECHTLRMV